MSLDSLTELLFKFRNNLITDKIVFKLDDYVDYIVCLNNEYYSSPYEYHHEKLRRVYLIKDPKSKRYISIAVILNSETSQEDLFAYVMDNHRNKGLISMIMEETILPHLFQNRDKIRMTVSKEDLGERYDISCHIAEKLGFKSSDGFEFFLYKKHYTGKIIDNPSLSEFETKLKTFSNQMLNRASLINEIFSQCKDEPTYRQEEILNIIEQVKKIE